MTPQKANLTVAMSTLEYLRKPSIFEGFTLPISKVNIAAVSYQL